MTHGLAGRPKSPEHRAKLSAALKGKPITDDLRAKLLAAAKREKSPEHRAKIAESNRKRAEEPDRREALQRAQAAARAQLLERVERGEVRTATYGWYSQLGEMLRERDGDLCQLCLGPIDFSVDIRTPLSRSVDHVVPSYAGGSDDLENLWLAHLACNQRKGARWVGREDGTADIRRNQ